MKTHRVTTSLTCQGSLPKLHLQLQLFTITVTENSLLEGENKFSRVGERHSMLDLEMSNT